MATPSLFPAELFVFLSQLAEHNDREWFTANKERYIRTAREPLRVFIIEMGERLQTISPSFVADPRTSGGSAFRIYRDTRFARDKRPYKLNIGCQFRHSAGKDVHAPGFYVHLQPGESFAGGGIWRPPTDQLTKIRSAIAAKGGEWTGIKEFIRGSGSLELMPAERLVRPPRGFDLDHPLIEDLKAKSFFAGRSFTDEEVASAAFPDQVEETFHDLVPLMRFLTLAVGLTF